MTGSQRLRLLGVTMFVFTCIGALLFLLHLVGVNVKPGEEHYRARVAVPTAVSLAQFADVRQAGVVIGEVSKLEPSRNGGSTALELELDGESGPIYRDATVLVRAKSIAEENYVELDPGNERAGELPDGETLPVERALEAFQNDDVFSILNDLRRRDLRRALGGLGPGLGDGRGLNRTLGSSSAFADDASPFARILAQERRHVAGVVDSFGRVTQALGERRTALQTLTRRAKTAAEAVAARDERFRATLEELPPFLAQGRATADRLKDFSTGATPVLRDLRLATEDLAPTVRGLEPAARAGRLTVAELERFSRVAQPAVRRLRPFSESARRFVPPFGGFLRQANPFLAYLNPYWRELTTVFATQGSHTQNKDEIGNVARVLLPISRDNFPATLPPEIEEFVDELAAPFDTRGTDPYPAPGDAGNPTSNFSGQYPRLEAEPPYR